MHGVVKNPSWTTLSLTAAAGAASITLDQSLAVLEWEEGDEIVITTTDICDSSSSKSEVAVV
jgi:hypothetical protein